MFWSWAIKVIFIYYIIIELWRWRRMKMVVMMVSEEGKMGRLYTFLNSGASKGKWKKKWSERRKSEGGIANYPSADHHRSPTPAHQTLISISMSELYLWRWSSPMSSLQILILQILICRSPACRSSSHVQQTDHSPLQGVLVHYSYFNFNSPWYTYNNNYDLNKIKLAWLLFIFNTPP